MCVRGIIGAYSGNGECGTFMGVDDEIPILNKSILHPIGRAKIPIGEQDGNTDSANSLRCVGTILPERIKRSLGQLNRHQTLREECFVLETHNHVSLRSPQKTSTNLRYHNSLLIVKETCTHNYSDSGSNPSSGWTMTHPQ